jgi:hypothetical protein
MTKAILLAILIATTGAEGKALARVGPEPRECVMNVGPVQMMFSAFQQQKTLEPFCRHVPDLGPTLIILDARQGELRSMTLEIRILRDVGQQDWRENLDANTDFFIAPNKYISQTGTLNFGHYFKVDGNYIALVKATTDDGAREYVGQYYFSVGETTERYILFAMILFVLCFVSLGIWRRDKGEPTRPSHAFEGETAP